MKEHGTHSKENNHGTTNSNSKTLTANNVQNSTTKEKVNFLKDNTIELPISFIVGCSFISGSILGSLFSIN